MFTQLPKNDLAVPNMLKYLRALECPFWELSIQS